MAIIRYFLTRNSLLVVTGCMPLLGLFAAFLAGLGWVVWTVLVVKLYASEHFAASNWPQLQRHNRSRSKASL